MRNSKAKTMKKTALLTLSLLLIAAGSAFADTNWTNLVNDADSQSSLNLGGDATVTSTLNLPPVPAVAGAPSSYTIYGNNHTVDATGYTGVVANVTVDTTINNLTIQNASSTNTAINNFGGAINNNGATLKIRNSRFDNNKAVNGGAIENAGTGILDISGTTFEGNSVSNGTDGATTGLGGAIYNSSTVTTGDNLIIKNSTFKNNYAGSPSNGGFGGAIYHSHGNASIDNVTFEGNYTEETNGNDGGAIANRANIVIKNSRFTDNHAFSSGGAILNDGTATTPSQNAHVQVSGTEFTGNYGKSGGGAIHNASSDTGFENKVTINKNTSFTNNYITNGSGGIAGSGGAISNNGADASTMADGIVIIGQDVASSAERVTFTNNIASNGGAISNSGDLRVYNADFISNGVVSSLNTTLTAGQNSSNGGAIYNVKSTADAGAKMLVQNSRFIGNIARTRGGAIYNASQAEIRDSVFYNNAAGDNHSGGGAIYTVSVTDSPNTKTTIIADKSNVVFGDDNSYENKQDSLAFAVGTGGNKVYGDFLAKAGREIIIKSEVAGAGADKTVISIGDNSGTYTGTVRFVGKDSERNDEKLKNTRIEMNSGVLAFNHDAALAESNILYMNGGTLNLHNDEFYNQFRPSEFHLASNSHIILDVDLANQKMDGLYQDLTNPNFTVTDGAKLIIDQMYAKGEANGGKADIQFTNSPVLQNGVVDSSPLYDPAYKAKIVQGAINKYAVTQYDVTGSVDADGNPDPEKDGVYFGFHKVGPSDPAISGPVAAQAAYIMMDNIYRQSFANMDMIALMTPEQREMIKALRCGNRIDWKREKGYVTGVFAPNTVPEERDGLYVRPFANFENVPLKNGPRVSNVFYGSLIGGESDLIDLGHGWDGTFSFFGAYHGSHQAYNGVDIWQNGGTLGAVGTVYKGRFFSGLTANIGASAAEARHGFGNDQFPILMTGAAWKSGYNWGLARNRFIIQPSYMMSYTFVNVFDYNSASGARITQDPLNALEIIPGVRFIGNLKNGWQPYLGANITWNIMDRTKFYANNVMLPQLSVKPFVEYGFGVQKRYGDRFTGYGQAMFRSGGRNGVAFTLGMRWALGN